MMPLSIQACGGNGAGEQRRAWRPALPTFGAEPSPGRRCWRVRVPPGRQPTWVESARTERCQRRGGGRGAAERVRPATREAAEQTGQCQRIGDALVGRRQGLERRILPAEASGRLGDGVRQRARAGAERGECRRGGQAGVAECQIERVHPGVRVGEKPGGLGQREARQQPVADRVGGGRDAGVEPGQRVAGIGQCREQHRQVRAPSANRRPRMRMGADVDGRRSASVSSGVSSQGGRSRSSAVSSSSNGVSSAMAACPQVLVFAGP